MKIAEIFQPWIVSQEVDGVVLGGEIHFGKQCFRCGDVSDGTALFDIAMGAMSRQCSECKRLGLEPVWIKV